MKTCPKCFDMNPPAATACKRCGLPFDQTAVNLGRNCPAGRHVMDPLWTVCAFCKAEGLVMDEMGDGLDAFPANGPAPPPPRETLFERRDSGDLTADGILEDGPGGTQSEWGTKQEDLDAVYPVPSRYARTRFESASGGKEQVAAPEVPADDWSKVRKTAFDDSPAIPLQGGTPMGDSTWGGSPSGNPAGRGGEAVRRSKTGYAGVGAPQVAAGDQRKIVGILITYTWRPEGQIFPVREGRNWIGRDPNQADIAIEQDETLSSVNSTIAFRTKFMIGDKDSMGGTYVNGKAVEELSHPLPNYAKIRTGSTTWTFIAIDPPVDGTAAEPGS